MDCERFEAEIQTQLDAKKELQLSDSADAHRLVCEPCDNSWQVYLNLQKGFHFGVPCSVSATFNFADQVLSELENNRIPNDQFETDFDEPQVASIASKLPSGMSHLDSEIPVAAVTISNQKRSTSSKDSFWNLKNTILTGGGIAAIFLVALFLQNAFLEQMGSGKKSNLASGLETPGSTNGVATDSNKGKSGGANEANRLKNPGIFGGDHNIIGFSNQISQSFREFDKQWQSYGPARVTVESVPGIREGTFPITGTFDILRHNLSEENNLKRSAPK